MSDDEKTMPPKLVPTWGYDADGEGKLFHLADDEDLPEGYFDSPPVKEDTSKIVPTAFEDDEADEYELTDEELDAATAPDDD